MDPHTQRAEAERWLGIAAKLLTARDFLGSKTFAIRAREADPNNAVSDQILAVVDTVLGGQKRVNASQQPDWYSVLQLPRLVRDPDLIADHYRRLVLCLNPERNRFPFADYALQLVMDAWSVLSDPTKKWLFDNELALYVQQGEPVAAAAVAGGGDSVTAGGGGGAGGGGQLNTFQFFQPQPPPPQQQQQQQQQQPPPPPMWQQQQPPHQQINQREFLPLPTQQPQVPPQWQMRDPNPSKGGGGERNKGVLNGIGVGVRGAATMPPVTPTSTPITARPVPRAPSPAHHPRPPSPSPSPPPPPPPPQPQPQKQPPVSAARVTVAVAVSASASASAAADGNAGNVPNTNFNNNDNDDDDSHAASVAASVAANENNDEVVVEEVESFWTACPYCFYIYEYQKVYQECTLRCQNCRKGFHAVQVPNPPPIDGGGSGGGVKEKGKVKDKENSFCCWGFFPLGFSMTAWKKQNQFGKMSGSSNWVPFSPMFATPVANGGGNFQWFDKGGGNAFVGPKNVAKKSSPRVYIDDEDFLEFSEPSDSDSSDRDWRNHTLEKNKKRKRGKIGARRRGKLRKAGVLNQVNQNVASGGGVSVGGEALDDGSDGQVVVGLAADDKSNTRKTVPAALMRKQTRRSVKDVGRLDLNVEFNNEGEEHAPAVSAVNGEEDGIENIAFFEGLDEFLSTLPILNVGDEKAKPS